MPLSPTPELMRQQNRAVILETIQAQGPISRVDLANLLNLNPATITRISRMLIDEGLILEEGEGENKGAGRKPVMLRFNHRARLVIGVSIHPHQMTGIVADLAGTTLNRRTLLLHQKLSVTALLSLVEELFSENPGYRQRLVTVCIASEKYPTEDFYALREELTHKLGLPILWYDPATLAAVAEAEIGRLKEQVAVFALFYLGSQSLSCIYINGESRTGSLGLANNGQPLAELVCDKGLIETFEALKHAGNSHHPTPARLQGAVSVQPIFEAARNGEPMAKRAVDQMAKFIALAAAWITHAFHIQHVVIAGPWIRAADVLIPAIKHALADITAHVPEIIPTALKDEASLMGAVRMAVRVADTTV